LLILAAEPKWLAVQAAQAAVLKSLLQLAIHVPVLETVRHGDPETASSVDVVCSEVASELGCVVFT
jgi:predicted nucleotidyltransferase